MLGLGLGLGYICQNRVRVMFFKTRFRIRVIFVRTGLAVGYIG